MIPYNPIFIFPDLLILRAAGAGEDEAAFLKTVSPRTAAPAAIPAVRIKFLRFILVKVLIINYE